MSSDLTSSLDPDFERSVTAALCTEPEFFGLFGVHMDPELCADPACQWAVKAAKAIHKDLGVGPSSEAVVFQRLQQWADDGLVKSDVLEELEDVFDDAWDANVGATALAAELRPVLQKHRRHLLVKQILKAHGRGEDCEREAKLLLQLQQIGTTREHAGYGLQHAESLFAKYGQLDRFPTGIDALDNGLNGGFPRGAMNLWIGGTGDGKSMALSMCAAVALLFGKATLYVTLEIPEFMVMSRLCAALTGYAADEFERQDEEALERFDIMRPQLGLFDVVYMQPGYTTVGDVDKYIDKLEQQWGQKLEFLSLDYGARLAAEGKRGTKRSEVSTYSTGELVATQLRDGLIVPRQLIGHTAIQSNDRGTKKIKGKDDGADSQHWARIADNVVTVNVDEQAGGESLMTLKAAKHRTGRAGFTVGPYPTEFGYGCLCRNNLLEATDSDELWSAVF